MPFTSRSHIVSCRFGQFRDKTTVQSRRSQQKRIPVLTAFYFSALGVLRENIAVTRQGLLSRHVYDLITRVPPLNASSDVFPISAPLS
jgi:hypothetical protein